jgi:hypothetical protein
MYSCSGQLPLKITSLNLPLRVEAGKNKTVTEKMKPFVDSDSVVIRSIHYGLYSVNTRKHKHSVLVSRQDLEEFIK